MRIAIVGGGCSGALVAIQLLRKGFDGPLTIIEPRAELARGIAYSTTFPGHLLNVVAEKMSALPSEPAHFIEWLRAHHYPDAHPGLFAPRHLYGDYLSGLLNEQLSRNRHQVRHLRLEMRGIELTRDTARLTLEDGSTLEADKVVLAIGNPPSGEQIWTGDALTLRSPRERILLIGAGQTAVDAVLAFQSQSPECRVYMLCRSGLLPQTHLNNPPPVPATTIQPGQSLTQILRELRRQARAAAQSGLPWQSVIDALRPVSNSVWASLSLTDRRRFLRHLKTFWETHRSRMPPSIGEQMHSLRKQGRVEVIAGRLIETHPVRIGLRQGGQQTLDIDRIIHCTGIHEYYRTNPRPLIADLMRNGLATPDDLGIGFHTDPYGALIGPASHLLYTLGTPRRGELFETIAVPEIRAQAEALAEHLLSGCA